MIDRYKHLNDKDRGKGPADGVLVGIEEIAVQVDRLNYGAHRLLSAIARNRLAVDPSDELGLGIKALLDRGAF